MTGLIRRMTAALVAVLRVALLAGVIPASAAAQVPPPSLTVQASIKVYYGERHYPSDTSHSLQLTWKTTHADSISILDGPSDPLAPSGSLELPLGSYILVASGPGGVAVRVFGGFMTSRPGPGLDGQIYRFTEQFEPSRFDRESQKLTVLLKHPIGDAQNAVISYLQTINYTAVSADSRYFPGGTFVYTSNYAEHELLRQDAGDREQNGELRRQGALVVMLRPGSKPSAGANYDLYVMGIVLRNRPRQDDKWVFDPSGPDLIRPFCRSVLYALKARLEK